MKEEKEVESDKRIIGYSHIEDKQEERKEQKNDKEERR